MSGGAGAPAPWPWLLTYLAVLAFQRASELRLSARHTAALRARGAIEHGAALYPWIVALHVAWPLALIAEVAGAGARPFAWWPAALVALLAASALRIASMRALGELWTTRVLVLPDHPRVTRGVYRWLAHPAYAGVALELLAAPLLFGAWRTAIAASIVHATLLTLRVRDEERALTPPGPALPHA